MKYDLRDCIGANLRRLSRITDGYYRKHLAGYNITENQMTILFVMSKLGKVGQGKLGDKLVLDRSTVSRNIRLLEKQYLVIRTTDYRPDIALTSRGKKLVNDLIPVWEKVMEELEGKLGADGLKLISTLEKKLM